MRPDEFIVELDTQDLRVENDLLMHEVAYLRGHLSRVEGRTKTLNDAIAAERAKIKKVEEQLAQSRQDLTSATKDLRWMLQKLEQSPVGWLIRRRSGFQNLARRWGTDQLDS